MARQPERNPVLTLTRQEAEEEAGRLGEESGVQLSFSRATARRARHVESAAEERTKRIRSEAGIFGLPGQPSATTGNRAATISGRARRQEHVQPAVHPTALDLAASVRFLNLPLGVRAIHHLLSAHALRRTLLNFRGDADLSSVFGTRLIIVCAKFAELDLPGQAGAVHGRGDQSVQHELRVNNGPRHVHRTIVHRLESSSNAPPSSWPQLFLAQFPFHAFSVCVFESGPRPFPSQLQPADRTEADPTALRVLRTVHRRDAPRVGKLAHDSIDDADDARAGALGRSLEQPLIMTIDDSRFFFLPTSLRLAMTSSLYSSSRSLLA